MSAQLTRAPVLNRRLELEAPVRLPDGAGGYAEDWIVLGTLWAELRPGSGREMSGLTGAMSRVPYRITVRAAPMGSDARPRPDQRFREGVRLFRVLAVTERDPGGRYLTCHAEEEVAT